MKLDAALRSTILQLCKCLNTPRFLWLIFPRYADRQEGVGVEARAGLTTYASEGWVAVDQHTEAGSRTLDYACEF